MAWRREKPGQFKQGDDLPTATDLNEINSGPSQLQGADVANFGDRVSISRKSLSGPITTDHELYFGKFVVREIHDNYLACVPYVTPVNAITGWWQAIGYDPDLGGDVDARVYVAKPVHLQRTFWDGATFIDDVTSITVTYTWVGTDKRTVSTGGTENVAVPYFEGDIIVALKGVAGFTGADGYPVLWTDVNAAARVWKNAAGSFVAKVTALVGTDCETGTGSPDYLRLPCGWAYAQLISTTDDGCTWPLGTNIYLGPAGGTTFRVGGIYQCWFHKDVPLEICHGDDTTGTGSPATKVPLFFAVGDNCSGLFTGTKVRLINVSAACVSGTIITTKTFETEVWVCGKLVSVT